MSKSREQLEEYIKSINIQGRHVLDIGGSQLPILDRVTGEPAEYTIMDLKEPHEAKLEPDIEHDIQEDVYHIKKKYDVAFCLEVSEYWYNPLQALKNINFLLKEKGIIYISFHFLYPVHKPHGLDHLRYTEFGAKKLLKEAGFMILETKNKTMMDASYNLYMNINQIEGNKYDKDYPHNVTGCIIKATKL